MEADLILTNGNIWTGNSAQPHATAIAIVGNKIAAVGDNGVIATFTGAKTKFIDLNGKFAVPGFIDNHTHFFMGGFHLLSVDLRDAGDELEFALRIARKAAEISPGQWLTGGGWDHTIWPGSQLPTKALIDQYTLDKPVFVTRLDIHMGLANSAALNQAGITADTPDPVGGKIIKDGSGQPTGILIDNAMDLVTSLIPSPSSSEYDKALEAAMNYAASLGITSVQDITSWDEWAVYKRFHQAGKLKTRIYARTPITEWEKHRDLVNQAGRGNQWLALGGVKGFVDGSVGSLTALFFEPYSDAPNTNGLLNEQMYPDDIMQQRTAWADAAGLQPSIHAIGDKANNMMLDIYQNVISTAPSRDRRFRIEHAQQLISADIRRFAELGVIASAQPAHLLDDGCWAEKRLGAERCKTSYPFRSLLETGARLTFGTDWPVVDLNPMLGIYAAVTRRPKNGSHPNGWIEQQKITIDEALTAYTATGAYAEFGEAFKGTIEVGKLADIAVLSQNLLTVDPGNILETTVLYTIVDGKVIYEAGKI